MRRKRLFKNNCQHDSVHSYSSSTKVRMSVIFHRSFLYPNEKDVSKISESEVGEKKINLLHFL